MSKTQKLSTDLQRIHLVIAGQVQGVGFRPFAYRLAAELHLTGWVLNDGRGVSIQVQGGAQHLKEFARRLREELPPLAAIDRCSQADAEVMVGEKYFEILASEGGEVADAQVTVDTATCGDCLREMNTPGDVRYKYPFINCTNCGPRYSIVTRIPYDRPNTTMADFALCPQCAAEYSDPASRRFHAQPVACEKCGPAVWLVDTRGQQIPSQDAIASAAQMLQEGKILAIKGLGGFHLACRADDDHVVRRLRQRKRRDAKPFAVMVADLKQADRLVRLTDEARQLLSGSLRPIVILPANKEGDRVAASVAQGLTTVGIMLAYTPLHHLLFQHGLGPLVMTSGNYSDEPLVKDNDSAISHLGRIADALLLHNRRIERRVDDSVVQARGEDELVVLRRGRGYAPQPVRLAAAVAGGPAVLAVGSELKNTICLLKGDHAVLSEHIGDLKDGRTYRHFIDTISHLEALYDLTPELVACDMHPHYLSTEYAVRRHHGELAGRWALPIARVQHHHAHVASCLAENAHPGPVIGLACDGTGHGDDGANWGCEILKADLRSYERLGHLRYLPLAGGDSAAVDTYRPAVAALYDTFGPECMEMDIVGKLEASKEAIRGAMEMLSIGVNCPPSSSLGRWFDAVAAFCRIADRNAYEGQAPARLETAAREGVVDGYGYRVTSGGPFVIDLRPMVEQIVTDATSGADIALIAAKFHNTVVAFLADAAGRARTETGLGVVALSGGCFANRYLSINLKARLEAMGFTVLTHRSIPCNDGGVALGQAVIAAARRTAPGGSESRKINKN